MSASQNLGTLFVQLEADSKAFIAEMSKATGIVKEFKRTTEMASGVAMRAGASIADAGLVVGSSNKETLFHRLNEDSKAAAAALQAGTVAVSKFGNKAKEVSEKFGSAGMMVMALGGAALKLASTVDGRAAKSLAGLQKNATLLAVQISDALEPAVRSISSGLKTAANWFASLDEGTKKAISTFAIWTVGLAVAAKAVGAVAGVLSGLSSIIGAVASAVAAVGLGPIALVIGAVVALAAGIAALHYAFRTNLGGIADLWKKLVDWLSETWGAVFGTLGEVFDAWVKNFLTGVELVLKGIAAVYDAQGDKQKALGFNMAANAVSVVRQNFTGAQIFKTVVAQAVDFGKDMAGNLWSGFKREWGQMLNDSGIGKMLARFTSAPAGAARQPGMLTPHLQTGAISGAVSFADIAGPGSGATIGGKNVLSAGNAFLGSMEMIAKETERHARELKKAQALEFRAKWDAAQAALNEQKMARASATGDLTGLSDAQVKAVTADTGGAWKDLTEAQKTFGNFAGRMADTVLGGLDKAGQAIGSIINGAVQGGVWGAVIAAFMELAKHMASFQRLIGFLNNVLARVGAMLEPLLKGIFDAVSEIIAVVVESLAPIFASLQPLFDAIAAPIKALAPTLGLLGFLFKELGPIIAAIVTMLGVVFHALEPVMRILFEVLRVVLLVIFAVLEAIANIWNGIIEAIATMVQFILNVITLGLAQGWAKDVADEIRKGKADTDAMAKSRQDLNDATWDSVNAQNAQTAAAWDAAAANDETAKTAREVADALTNVPSGYKVALARFNAMDAGQRYAAATPGTSAHGGSGGGSTTIINGDVNINAEGQDAAELAQRIENAKRRAAGQRRGNADDEGI